MSQLSELVNAGKPACVPFAQQARECVIHILGGTAIAIAIATVGSVTGCNNYVLAQIEQDVATSTSQPLLATSINQDDLDDDARYLASKQYADAKHANRFLASNRGGYE